MSFVNLAQTALQHHASSIHPTILTFDPWITRVKGMYTYFRSCTHAIPITTFSEENLQEKFGMNCRDFSGYHRQLQVCIDTKNVTEAKNVYFDLIKAGFKPGNFYGNRLLDICFKCQRTQDALDVFDKMPDRDSFSWNTMIAGYAKCGMLEESRQVFEKMPLRDVISWSCIITGLTRHGYDKEAMDLFSKMKLESMVPNQYTLASILRACAGIFAISQGEQIHAYVINIGMGLNVYVATALVDMYGKCKRIEVARKIFDKMPERNTVLWTAMISGYAQNGLEEQAFKLFQNMLHVGNKPNQFTYSSVLAACSGLLALEPGRQVHSCILKSGFAINSYLGGSLMLIYSKCRSLNDARKLLEEVSEGEEVCCNVMLSGYTQNGQAEEALKFFGKMQSTSLKVDHFTFPTVLSACANLSALEQGNQIHALAIKIGFKSNIYVGNALVDMYVKCRSLDEAHKVFDSMPHRDVVSWTSIFGARVQNGNSEEVLQLFSQMRKVGIIPDGFNFASVLSACASLSALEQGKQVHALVSRSKPGDYLAVHNSLVTMYAKCGSIGDAYLMFKEMSIRDLVSWTAMIVGYAQNGCSKEALRLYEEMLEEGFKPDHVTLVGVLFACSHAGLVKEGRHYFNSMLHDHGITLRTQHYACMIDLLGRAGHMDEAEDLLIKMPVKPDANVWKSLLAACRIHGNMELGQRAAENLFELEPQNSASYVLLSNLYAAAGRWDDVAKVRKMMKDRKVTKEPGCSWVEANGRLHVFSVEDRGHPQTVDIYKMLDKLAKLTRGAGYVPNTNFALHDVEGEHKEDALSYHSEKLAVAFGLIISPSGKPIRIVKNLRICGDCHTFIKFVSKIVGQQIIVRDANRFHHFNLGFCSCGDYW